MTFPRVKPRIVSWMTSERFIILNNRVKINLDIWFDFLLLMKLAFFLIYVMRIWIK